MINPLEILASRLEAARQGKEQKLRDFIEKNNPGGMAGWQKEYEAMSPQEKENLVPLSTRAIRGAAKGIQSFAQRLESARSKVMSKLKGK